MHITKDDKKTLKTLLDGKTKVTEFDTKIIRKLLNLGLIVHTNPLDYVNDDRKNWIRITTFGRQYLKKITRPVKRGFIKK